MRIGVVTVLLLTVSSLASMPLSRTAFGIGEVGCTGIGRYKSEMFSTLVAFRSELELDGLGDDRDPNTYSSDEWTTLANDALAWQRALKEIDPPDWAEPWHQLQIERAGLIEQVAKSVAFAGVFAAIAFSDSIDELEAREVETARYLSYGCRTFAGFVRDWDKLYNGEREMPSPTPTLLPTPTPSSSIESNSALSLLPIATDLPPGFERTENDNRTIDAVAASFANPVEAKALMEQWGWRENAYRTFELPADSASDPRDTSFFNVSVHYFSEQSGATLALSYFADAVIAAQGMVEFDVQPIGEETRALSGSPDGTNLVIVYVSLGGYLIRIGGSSLAGDPTQDVIELAKTIVARTSK